MRFFLLAFATAILRNNLIPADVQAEQMRQMSGSSKVDQEPLSPACSSIGCADIHCIEPLKMVRRPGQCCPICWAEDHEVPLDRHQAMKSDYVVPVAPGAPPLKNNCRREVERKKLVEPIG
jgi:hypothetical protein